VVAKRRAAAAVGFLVIYVGITMASQAVRVVRDLCQPPMRWPGLSSAQLAAVQRILPARGVVGFLSPAGEGVPTPAWRNAGPDYF
jgi:hypothetical protein